MSLREVNDTQLDVLRQIVGGLDPAVDPGSSFKLSARALQDRRLVVVRRKGGVWGAEPTDAGRYFAEHESYPDGHWPTPKSTKSAPGGTAPKASVPSGASSMASGSVTGRKSQRITTRQGRGAAEQLVADVEAAGGQLVVETAPYAYGYWDNLVSTATRHKKVPTGKLLRIAQGPEPKQQTISLIEAPEWIRGEPTPVLVADALRSPHPVVAALRADAQAQRRMKQPVRMRALRILDALAKAATRKEYEVAEAREPREPWQLAITVRGDRNVVRISELTDKVPHQPTKKELADQQKYSWTRIPEYDKVPNEKLELQIVAGYWKAGGTFKDGKTATLEERLPDLLRELEMLAYEEGERAAERKRQKEARRHRWERVRDEAISQAREHHRAAVLSDQVRTWRAARELGEYLDALDRHVQTLPGPERGAAQEWLSWAERRRGALDPLAQRLAMPPDPEFTAETLKPYMRGLSPYGPEEWWR